MGTPFVIAMRNGEDLYRWIFSPYDGNIQSAGRMLVNLPDLTVGASVLSAEMIASGTAT